MIAPADPTATARLNRERWDADADAYQREHAADLAGDKAAAWGIWRIPEDDLEVLGDVSDRTVLELGCGAAQWSLALRRRGATSIGLDNSGGQLRHARRLMHESGTEVPLVHAAAEKIPFQDESFDIVFSDFGGMHFADPYMTVPEVARVLKPGGLLAFSVVSPVCDLCWPNDTDDVSTTLHRDYFGMHRQEWPDEPVSFNLNYGDWISVFRANGFVIDALIEPQPPEGTTSSYGGRSLDWARRWPTDSIWRVHKETPG